MNESTEGLGARRDEDVENDGGSAAVIVLARLAGLDVPSGDVEILARALRSQLASFEALEMIDPMDVEPDLSFDPRWHDD